MHAYPCMDGFGLELMAASRKNVRQFLIRIQFFIIILIIFFFKFCSSNSPVKQNDIVIAYMQIIFSINFGRLVTHDEQQMKISKYIEAALAAADFIKQRNSGNGKTTDNPSQNDIELLFQSSIPQFINQMKTCVPAVGQLLDSRTFKRLSQISDKTISKISGKNLPEMFAQHTESVRSNLGLLLRR